MPGKELWQSVDIPLGDVRTAEYDLYRPRLLVLLTKNVLFHQNVKVLAAFGATAAVRDTEDSAV